ncbi:hypothetical protein ACS25C_17880 [Dickeya undicola]
MAEPTRRRDESRTVSQVARYVRRGPAIAVPGAGAGKNRRDRLKSVR